MLPFGYTGPRWNYEAPGEGGTSNSGGDSKFSAADAQELEAFRELGWSASDINLAMQDYARLAQAEQESKKAPKKDLAAKEDKADLEKMDPKVREELFKLVPELKRLSKIDELERKQAEHDEDSKRIKQSNFQDMQSNSRRDVLYFYQDKLGGDTTTEQGKEALNAVLSTVSDYIGSDARLLQRFMDGDKRVTEDAMAMMQKEGRFKHFSIPKPPKQKKQLPGMYGHEGDVEEIRNLAETNKEKYAKFSPNKRWAEMSKDIFNHVWKED